MGAGCGHVSPGIPCIQTWQYLVRGGGDGGILGSGIPFFWTLTLVTCSLKKRNETSINVF